VGKRNKDIHATNEMMGLLNAWQDGDEEEDDD
jgi:hypothetical protein